MNIEIMAFHPLSQIPEKNILTGTIRIHLKDLGIDILGIYVQKKKDKWFFTLPGRNSKHKDTGLNVWYPFITLHDKKAQNSLVEEIRKKTIAFIEPRLINGLYQDQEVNAAESKEKYNSKTRKVEEHTPIDIIEKINTKVWDSPPPLKVRKRN